jgi:hypothetical protein
MKEKRTVASYFEVPSLQSSGKAEKVKGITK